MPYRPPHRYADPAPEQQPRPGQNEPVQATTWERTPEPDGYITNTQPSRTPAAEPADAHRARVAKAEDAPAQTPGRAGGASVGDEPQPAVKPTEVHPPVITMPQQPPATNTAATVPAGSGGAASATGATPALPDLKQITNTGPIPTAARVEGDPTRVWNPLNHTKKIRIINPKTNKPYESGTKLKVRNTNYQFYVP